MRSSPNYFVLSCAGIALLLGTQPSVFSCEQIPTSDSPTRKACIDPDTGQLVDPTKRPECAGEVAPDGADVELKAVPIEKGGEKVDLKGRFRHDESKAPKVPAAAGRIAIINPSTGQVAVGAEVQLLQQAPATRQAVQEIIDDLERQATLETTTTPPLQAVEIDQGGVQVDLQGRFRSPMIAVVSEDGTVVVSHD